MKGLVFFTFSQNILDLTQQMVFNGHLNQGLVHEAVKILCVVHSATVNNFDPTSWKNELSQKTKIDIFKPAWYVCMLTELFRHSPYFAHRSVTFKYWHFSSARTYFFSAQFKARTGLYVGVAFSSHRLE